MCHNVLSFNRKDGRCILDLIVYAHPACRGDVSRRPRAAEVAADGFAPKPRPFFSLPMGRSVIVDAPQSKFLPFSFKISSADYSIFRKRKYSHPGLNEPSTPSPSHRPGRGPPGRWVRPVPGACPGSRCASWGRAALTGPLPNSRPAQAPPRRSRGGGGVESKS